MAAIAEELRRGVGLGGRERDARGSEIQGQLARDHLPRQLR